MPGSFSRSDPVTVNTPSDSLIRRRILLGTASNYAGQLVAFGTLFFLTPFLLHRLGAEAYGLWVLIGSLVAYGSLLDLGLWGAIIKYVAEFRARGENEQARALVATALCLYTVLGLAVMLLAALAALAIPGLFNIPGDQQGLAAQLVLWMGIGAGLALPGTMPLAVLRGLQRYDLVSLVEISATLFTAAATVVLLLLGGGVIGVVRANIGGVLLMLASSAWWVQRAAPELRLGWRGANRQWVRTVVGYSWPLFVKDVAGRLQTKTDEITIGAFLPVAAIAPYNIARRLSEATHILTKQFMKVLLPLASELHAGNDRARLRVLYTSGTRLTLAIALAIGGTLILLVRPVLRLWVGTAYEHAAPIVLLLTAASFLATAQWPAGAVLQGMARHRLLAATALGAGLLNLALSLALVRPFGLIGVALGTLIPTALEFSIVVPYAMRVIGVSGPAMLREIFLPALGPALLMMLALYALQQFAPPDSLGSLMLVSGLGLAVFGLAYFLLGASRAERQTYQGIALNVFHSARAHLRRHGVASE
jgi:O-antigen/teichoic acid export membrane protein